MENATKDNSSQVLNELGKAIKSVVFGAVKGGLKGGIKGAVIGMVVELLPQLIKGITMTLVLMVTLTYFTFLSIPATLFQFDEGDNLTTETSRVDALLDTFPTVQNDIATEIKESFTGTYDEVNVTTDFTSTDQEWLTAITLVLSFQDIYAIDESDITTVATHSITHTFEEETRTDTDDEGNENEVSIANVSITDVGAELLMEVLEFDDLQKEWATFLHDNLVSYNEEMEVTNVP